MEKAGHQATLITVRGLAYQAMWRPLVYINTRTLCTFIWHKEHGTKPHADVHSVSVSGFRKCARYKTDGMIAKYVANISHCVLHGPQKEHGILWRSHKFMETTEHILRTEKCHVLCTCVHKNVLWCMMSILTEYEGWRYQSSETRAQANCVPDSSFDANNISITKSDRSLCLHIRKQKYSKCFAAMRSTIQKPGLPLI